QQRIKYARENAELQKETLRIADGLVKVNLQNEIDRNQALATLRQTEAGIPELEITLQQTSNRLCILLGIPPEDLQAGSAPQSSRRPPRKRPSDPPPTCCAAVPTFAGPSARPPLSAPR